MSDPTTDDRRPDDPTGDYHAAYAPDDTSQCLALTQSGRRCQREMSIRDYLHCVQHYHMLRSGRIANP